MGSKLRLRPLLALLLLVMVVAEAPGNPAAAGPTYSSITYQLTVTMTWDNVYLSGVTEDSGSLYFSLTMTLAANPSVVSPPDLNGLVDGRGTYGAIYYENGNLNCQGSGTFDSSVAGTTDFTTGVVTFGNFGVGGGENSCIDNATHNLIYDLVDSCFGSNGASDPTTDACVSFPVTGGSNVVSMNPNYSSYTDSYKTISGTAQLTMVSSQAATANTTTTVTCVPADLTAGTATTCTATVEGSDPTGVVTWTTSGRGNFSTTTCELNAGACDVRYTISAADAQTITASYGGDSGNAASVGHDFLLGLAIQCPLPDFDIELTGVRTQGSAVSTYAGTVGASDTLIFDGRFIQPATPITPACRYSLDVRVTITVTGGDGIPFQYNGPVLSSVGNQPIPDNPSTWLTLLAPTVPRPLGIWQAVARADVSLTNADPTSSLYGTQELGPYFSEPLPFMVQSENPSLSIPAVIGNGPAVANIATYGNITAANGNAVANAQLAQDPQTGVPTLSFGLSGKDGSRGFMTIVIPKASVPGGLQPTVVVNGIEFPFGGQTDCQPLASVQGSKCIAASFWQDAGNYYIRLFVHFSADVVTIGFDPPAFVNGQTAALVLGQDGFASAQNATTSSGLFAPGGPVFDSSGDLWVPDRANNRVLEFQPPFSDHMTAALVIGQPDFNSRTSLTSQTSLASPHAIAFDPSGNLWVADTFNSRVLEFKQPFASGMAASLVIGQTGFTSGNYSATQSGLAFPTGLAFDSSGNLWVADFTNSRVLRFSAPFSDGMAASLVIGHKDFTSYDLTTTRSGLSLPTSVAFDPFGNLWVADSLNNRTVEYAPPFTTGMNASNVLGQNGFTSRGACTASRRGLCEPVGVAFDRHGDLWVTDLLDNRVLEFASQPTSGMNASIVIGQSGFSSAGGATTASGLLFAYRGSYAITGAGVDPKGNLWVGDSLNNRILEYSAKTTIDQRNVLTTSSTVSSTSVTSAVPEFPSLVPVLLASVLVVAVLLAALRIRPESSTRSRIARVPAGRDQGPGQ